MSRPPETSTQTRPETHGAMEGLLATLDLTQTGEDRFQGVSPQVGWQRVFGGQVIAQALMAACRTVEVDRHVHSLHAYFMRPGDPFVPIDYEAERMRDGRSFATRRVVASQHGQAIFALSASFQFDEDGFEHQIEMPDVPMPDTLPGEQEIRDAVLKHAPAGIRRYWQQPRPIEIRPVLLKRYFARDALEPVQDVWVRATGPVPNDRHMQAVVLAYLSDMTLLDTSLHAHGTSIFDPGLQVASIDHAMWFHRPFSFDDWLLYTQDSPSASGSRGMNRGSLFNRQGQLIASVAQEGLIRKKADA